MAELIVVAPGALTTIQDSGRPGYAAMGVSPSGAFDRGAYEAGQRLLGNPDGVAALEVVLGGLRVTATSSTRAALTGALVAASVGGREVRHGELFVIEPGEELALKHSSAGIRAYVSFAGGIEVPRVLGSRSTDTLSGLGPAPVRAGDVLPLGASDGSQPAHVASLTLPTNAPVTLDVLPGPRSGWLTDPELAGEWTVSPASNRVGVRLSGPIVGLHRTGELPSEGVVRGAIQVPPGGQPVIFGPDHPTTGGYPVVGVLTDASCDELAQLRPGQRVRLRPLR
ncbi:MAG: biotin-dependent carboxyltransferase family protein [Propionibacteriaceae bacterium]